MRPAGRLSRRRARAAHCTLELPFPSCSCGKGVFLSQNRSWRSWAICVILPCVTQRSSYLRLLCWGPRRRLGPSNLLPFVAETYSLLSTILLLVQIPLSRVFPSLVLNRYIMRTQPPDPARGQLSSAALLRIFPPSLGRSAFSWGAIWRPTPPRFLLATVSSCALSFLTLQGDNWPAWHS